MTGATETPTAQDLAHPLETYVWRDVTVTTLREYWRRHPDILPCPLQGVELARWKDGQLAIVPANAAPDVLATYYVATRMLREVVP